MGVNAVDDVGLVENGHNFFLFFFNDEKWKKKESKRTCTVDVGVTDS